MAYLQRQNLLTLLEDCRKCTTGCPVIDQKLGGGIPCSSITELFGESGSGKTQICLQVALYVQLSLQQGGLGGSAIYFNTEFAFPLRRMQQIANAMSSSHATGADPCENIYVRNVSNIDHLIEQLGETGDFIETTMRKLPVRVIIIDSIASLFRSQFRNIKEDMVLRSSSFFQISTKLKQLAHAYDVAVIITNQVTDHFSDHGGTSSLRLGNLGEFWTSGRRVNPTLGLVWAHCVNSRFFLQRGEQTVTSQPDGSSTTRTVRRLHIVFAPHLPPGSVQFEIRPEGVRGLTLMQ